MRQRTLLQAYGIINHTWDYFSDLLSYCIIKSVTKWSYSQSNLDTNLLIHDHMYPEHLAIRQPTPCACIDLHYSRITAVYTSLSLRLWICSLHNISLLMHQEPNEPLYMHISAQKARSVLG